MDTALIDRAMRLDPRARYKVDAQAQGIFTQVHWGRNADFPAPIDAKRIEREAAELGVWHFLWMSKWRGVSSRGAVEAIVMAREALRTRWPDVDLDFNLTAPERIAQHLWNELAPDPTDLLPVLDAICEGVDGLFQDNEVRYMRFLRQRAYDIAHQRVAEPALDGFGL